MYHRWTGEDLSQLTRLWKGHGVEDIAQAIGVTVAAARKKAHQLGLRKPEVRRWTEEEKDRILEGLGRGESTAMLATTLGRSRDAVQNMITELGGRGALGPYLLRPWTGAEIVALKARYGTVPVKVLARELGRSPCAVRLQASRSGLSRRRFLRQLWTEAELVTLKARYGTVPVKALARELGRSPGAVAMKAGSLGLSTRRG